MDHIWLNWLKNFNIYLSKYSQQRLSYKPIYTGMYMENLYNQISGLSHTPSRRVKRRVFFHLYFNRKPMNSNGSKRFCTRKFSLGLTLNMGNTILSCFRIWIPLTSVDSLVQDINTPHISRFTVLGYKYPSHQ